MPMFSETDVRQAVRKHMASVSGMPDDSLIQWENTKLTPPDQEPTVIWAREQMLIASSRHLATRQTVTLGQYRFDLFTQFGIGTTAINTLSLNIRNQFKPEISLQEGSTIVQIYRTESLNGRQVEQLWWMLPIVIYWRTFSDLQT